MKRKISHDKTNFIKTVFLLIGLTPVVLLTFLWSNFSLAGMQAVIMIVIVLGHMTICGWYASRFHAIVFDDGYMYIESNQTIQKIKLEHIDKVVPLRIAFPAGKGKVYLVTIDYTDTRRATNVYFISKQLPYDNTSDDIPYLQQFRQAVVQDKYRPR